MMNRDRREDPVTRDRVRDVLNRELPVWQHKVEARIALIMRVVISVVVI